MRVKTLVLCSSSLAMLGLASTPALAQTSPLLSELMKKLLP